MKVLLTAAAASLGLILLAGAAGPAAPAPVSAPAAVEGGYTIDAVHSAAIFKVTHDNVGTFFGRFNDLSGSFDLSGEKPELKVTIKTDSVDTNNADRDKHIRSADFFNTKQFPEATFTSTSVKKTGEGAYDVAGNLTLCGATKPVTIKITSAKTGENSRSKKPTAGFEAVMVIKRSEFNITKYPGGLGEDVTIMVGVEGAK